MKCHLISFPFIIVLSLGHIACNGKNNSTKNSPKSNDTVIETEKNMDGTVNMITTVVNGKKNGPYKMYYDDGTLFAEGTYINDKLVGEVKAYTPEGKLASIEVWDTVPNSSQNISQMVSQKIFWQEIPGEDGKYLFVSDSGYFAQKDGVYNRDTTIIPDNIIDERSDANGTTLFIWKKGKREFYKRISRN